MPVSRAVAPRTPGPRRLRPRRARRMADPGAQGRAGGRSLRGGDREVDRLDWIERRLPCPKVLATSPLPGGGHAVVLSLPPGTPAAMPEHRTRPMRTVEEPGAGAAIRPRDPDRRLPVRRDRSTCASARSGGGCTRALRHARVHAAYNRYSPTRLFEILDEMRPADDDRVFTHGAFGLDVALLDLSGVGGVVDWGRAGVVRPLRRSRRRPCAASPAPSAPS